MADATDILKRVSHGELSVEDALDQMSPEEIDLGFARLDTDRLKRRGLAEVVYAAGKTPEHLLEITKALWEKQHPLFATRVTPAQVETVCAYFSKAVYHQSANALTLDPVSLPEPTGCVSVVAAGTSDMPVAEEAALTATRMGAHVERIYDVGVAGIHRLVKRIDIIGRSRAVVVVAGMEGALPSVVGGMIARPLVAVPTSIGYGANLHGISALLTMLNSCVPGITVVNIDNGYGAGVAAAMINRTGTDTK